MFSFNINDIQNHINRRIILRFVVLESLGERYPRWESTTV